MQAAINLYKWIVNQSTSDKLFAILFLIIIFEGYIIFRNAEIYRGDVTYYRNRLDNNAADSEKKIEECHKENKKAYSDLLERYKELYKESLKLK